MTENELSKIVVDAAFRIHRALGPGLFESVYEEILHYELQPHIQKLERQQPLPVIWDELKMDHDFRADLILDNKLIVEVKSVEVLAPIHKTQVLTYLRISGLKLGLLINFNVLLIKDGIVRIVNRL